jgi:hypothetical protein
MISSLLGPVGERPLIERQITRLTAADDLNASPLVND